MSLADAAGGIAAIAGSWRRRGPGVTAQGDSCFQWMCGCPRRQGVPSTAPFVKAGGDCCARQSGTVVQILVERLPGAGGPVAVGEENEVGRRGEESVVKTAMDLEMLLRLQGSAAISTVTNGGAGELWAQNNIGLVGLVNVAGVAGVLRQGVACRANSFGDSSSLLLLMAVASSVKELQCTFCPTTQGAASTTLPET